MSLSGTTGTLNATVAAPSQPRGWVVFATDDSVDPADAVQAARAFNALALGALSVDLSTTGTEAAMSDALLDAREWLIENEAASLPVGLGGAGTTASSVLRAARSCSHETPALIFWNGTFVSDPAPSSIPTLLLLDRGRSRRDRRDQRRAARKLGPRAELVISPGLGARADAIIRDWYEQALLRGERPAPLPVRRDLSRKLAVGLVAAAAIAVPVSAEAGIGTGSSLSARPIAGGKAVAAHRIAGDGFGASLAKPTLTRHSALGPIRSGALLGPAAGRWLGKPIAAPRISGDGFSSAVRSLLSRGSLGLTDGKGVEYFVNTDITYSTTSGASGAINEASFTASHSDVSTSAGGVTSSQLNDAFDGYNAMAVHVGAGAPSGPAETEDANFTYYNNNGVPSSDCSGRQLDFNPQVVSGVQMTRKVYVPTVGSYARWVNFFTNTTGAPITMTMYVANNLGSDANTRITGSSNGDTTADLTDSWVTSFQNFSGSTSSDPRLGHVLQGPGAATGLSQLHFVDGDDNPYWAYTITLAAGQTKAIANYAVAADSKAASATGAAALVTAPPVTCLSSAEQSEIVNFNLSPPAPAGSGEEVGYCAVAGDRNPVTGALIQPGTFLVLDPGQPATDPSYAGATPANYLQGLGIACGVPAGYVLSTEKVGYGGHGDPGLYAYYTKS
ncbi:MAG TPA: hypothetical protein VH063_06655 [Gaiellaceae bacterium]|nr:hypothetical protein [Gaiellaceae bacterium]